MNQINQPIPSSQTVLLLQQEQMPQNVQNVQMPKTGRMDQTSQTEQTVPALDMDQIEQQVLMIQMNQNMRMIPDISLNIRVNPLFSRLVQPLSEPEQEKLFDELSSSDSIPIIYIWQNCHLADQYLYELCVEYGIPYKICELSFDNVYQAALYICSVQLNSDKLTSEYRKYVIGQKLEYILQSSYKGSEAGSKYNIAAQIGHKLFLSAGTIIKYHSTSNALNTVFDQDEVFAKDILLGKIRISHENIPELARLMPDEIKAVAAAARRDNLGRLTLSFIRNEAQWSHVKNRAPQSRRERTEEKMVKNAAIRQMPQYDPDSEANSLCMTIDFWISSIQRVHSSSSFSKITNKASLQLMKKLSFLEITVKSLQESLVERGTA